MEEKESNINNLYLLMNKTFASLEGDFTNLEFKIMILMMIKTQKQLLQTYGECTEDVVKDMPRVIPCSFLVSELKQFKDRRNNLTLKKIAECFKSLNDKSINFVSAIDGGYVYSHLISEFKISEDNKEITASISREVFLFLLDYNGNFDYKKKFPHDKAIRKETKNIDYRKKGYSKQLFQNTNNIKSYYAQALNYRFRLALDTVCLRAKRILSCEVTYSLDQIKAYCGCSDKYARYYDFKERVIEPAIKELNERKLFDIEFIPVKKDCKGGQKVHSIIFKIEAGEVTRKEIEESLKYNNSKETKSADVIIEEENQDTLASSLVDLLSRKAKIKLAISTIQGFVDTYGENKTKRAINITINTAQEEKIIKPMRYIQQVLENLEAKEQGNINMMNNNINALISAKEQQNKTLKQLRAEGKDVMGFNNVVPREYDYDALEKQLLGWDKEDDEEDNKIREHYNSLLEDIKNKKQ